MGNYGDLRWFYLDASKENEWNEDNWFDLAYYVRLDMHACYNYEPSIYSFEGND